MPADASSGRVLGHEDLDEVGRMTTDQFADVLPHWQKKIRNVRSRCDLEGLKLITPPEMQRAPFRHNTVHFYLPELEGGDFGDQLLLIRGGDELRPVNETARYFTLT